jgi:hypothetical protein
MHLLVSEYLSYKQLFSHLPIERPNVFVFPRTAIRVNHKWIYQYILKDKLMGGDLYRHLRFQ